jgi:hypothetical protein
MLSNGTTKTSTNIAVTSSSSWPWIHSSTTTVPIPYIPTIVPSNSGTITNTNITNLLAVSGISI